MKKIYALLTFIAFTTTLMAQTKGITYQAVLYDPAYKKQTLPGLDNMLIPYANKSVCLRFQITDKNNQAIYIETQSTKTDPFGMVNLIIGQGTKIGGLVNSFDNIIWNTQANSLIVSLDNSGNCSDFKEATNQPFTASPFALGNTSINTADYELIANKSNNISVDANSTTKYPSVNAIKSYVDSKVGTIPDADASTKGKIQLAGDLAGTAAVPTVPGLALKVDKEAGKGLSTNDYTTAEKTKLTAIDMSTKQEVSNISNTIVADASSTTKYPSVKGIKDYVDGLSSAGGVSDGSITTLKIADNAIVNADVSPTAAIDFGKLNISKSNILGLDIVKSDIGLANVENTSDLSKPISSATQTALDLKANTADVSSSLALKANLASPTFTGTVSGIDKTMVGLGNIDNTTDLAKPISTATQTALDLKATTADVSSSLALKANLASPTFTGTVSGIDKTMVGLGSVDNTTDLAKPISTATKSALNLKASTADVTASLSLKEDTANKTIDVSTDGTSDVKFPSAKAVKTYSDAKVVDGITDAVTTSAPTQNAVFDALALKANTDDVTISLSLKEDTANKTIDVSTDGASDLKFPSAKAVKTYSDAKVVDAITDTVTTSAPTQNAVFDALALKANTADVTTSLGLKEDTANKTIDVSTDGTSDVKFPSAKAVKTYSDAKVVDGITDAVTTSAPSQNAVFDALALKASVVDVTTTEVTLATKINGKQLYAITGQFTASGTSAAITITKPAGMTDYYSLTTLKDGKTFRKQIISFDLTYVTNNVVTGSGFLTEIYPAATYTYVLEYFK